VRKLCGWGWSGWFGFGFLAFSLLCSLMFEKTLAPFFLKREVEVELVFACLGFAFVLCGDYSPLLYRLNQANMM
jgi:hypothetical protein